MVGTIWNGHVSSNGYAKMDSVFFDRSIQHVSIAAVLVY